MTKVALAALLVCTIGCSSNEGDGANTGGTSSGGSGGSSNGGTGGSSTGGSSTGGSSSGWNTLIEGDWTLPSGEEDYLCVLMTLTEDLYVSAFRPLLPPGTHHTVLTLETNPTEPDGSFACDAGTNGPHMIYGSGLGTAEFTFPSGIAVPLKAGQQLVLNLHLFNVNPGSLSGTSGIEVTTTTPDAVVHEAQVTLAGKQDGLVAEPGTTTQNGICTLQDDTTIFAVLPHMHQLGAHLKAAVAPPATPITLLDVDYSFDDQQYFPVTPEAVLSAGDVITVDCTYDNPKSTPVYYGDSSTDEMCFAAIYEYPARNRTSYYCTD